MVLLNILVIRRENYFSLNFADEQNEGRKNTRKSFKLGGVPVNAKTLAACLDELAPLDNFLPDTKEERLKWQLDFRYVKSYFNDNM